MGHKKRKYANTNTGDDFRTSHKLTFTKADVSPFPGFAAYALGGVTGFFSVTDMTVDFMVGDIEVGEHMVDSVEWFTEMAIQEGLIGVRVLGCKDAELRAFLIKYHGFKPARENSLFKQATRES